MNPKFHPAHCGDYPDHVGRLCAKLTESVAKFLLNWWCAQ